MIYKGAPIQMTSQYLLQTNLGCFNNRSVQLKQLAKVCAFRLRAKESQPMTTSGVVGTNTNAQTDAANTDTTGKDKDKPKKKVFMTTLPPKTGAIYKESYKDKLRKEKEEVDRLERQPAERQPTLISSHTQASTTGTAATSPNKVSTTPSLLSQVSSQSTNSNASKPILALAKKPNLFDSRKTGLAGNQPTNAFAVPGQIGTSALGKPKQPLQLPAASINKTMGPQKPGNTGSSATKPDQQGAGMQARPFLRSNNPPRPSGPNVVPENPPKPKHGLTLSLVQGSRQSSSNVKDSDDEDEEEGDDEQTE